MKRTWGAPVAPGRPSGPNLAHMVFRAGVDARKLQAEIEFFRQLEKAEQRSFASIIQFVENEIGQIKAGRLYADLD